MILLEGAGQKRRGGTPMDSIRYQASDESRSVGVFGRFRWHGMKKRRHFLKNTEAQTGSTKCNGQRIFRKSLSKVNGFVLQRIAQGLIPTSARMYVFTSCSLF